MKRVLLLGGLDPSGGAGITVDATVAALHDVAPLPIALTTTVQGLRGFVSAAPVSARVWRRQIEEALHDGPVAAVKVGYVGDAAVIAEVADALGSLVSAVPLIVDPVMSATAGGMGSGQSVVAAYRDALIPLATLVTPNSPELAQLGDGDPSVLLRAGAGAVLHKGGHSVGQDVVDELWAGGPPSRFVRPRLRCGLVRGTGCALACAIAARLALGSALSAACEGAGDWLASLLGAVQPRPDGLPQSLPLSRGGTTRG